MQNYLIKVFNERFNQEYLIQDKILSIDFEDIGYPLLNCFKSNDMGVFTHIRSFNRGEDFKKLFNGLTKKSEAVCSEIDIKKVSSLRSSKSKSSGRDFKTMYLFGKDVYVDRDDKWEFEDCISHVMNHLARDEPRLELFLYQWNGKYHWDNSGGSHHFAVASFHAQNNKIDYSFQANIIEISIDRGVANNLLVNYEMFIVCERSQHDLEECFNEKDICLFDVGYLNNVLVVFDKNNNSIKKHINLLKNLDSKKVLHFNRYLKERLV